MKQKSFLPAEYSPIRLLEPVELSEEQSVVDALSLHDVYWALTQLRRGREVRRTEAGHARLLFRLGKDSVGFTRPVFYREDDDSDTRYRYWSAEKEWLQFESGSAKYEVTD